MRENLFEMGADFGDEWSSDNKKNSKEMVSTEVREPSRHKLHFAKEKRRGKVVTVVKPFYLSKKDLQDLLKILKKKLGTGGTIRENSLEFQGDISDSLDKSLKLLGYSFVM